MLVHIQLQLEAPLDKNAPTYRHVDGNETMNKVLHVLLSTHTRENTPCPHAHMPMYTACV